MSLVRVQTIWTGVAGSPYYTNLYALGPLSTNNGNDLATAWRAFLVTFAPHWGLGVSAQIKPELLEFDEGTGVVTGAGTTIQAAVAGTGAGDQLPRANQGLIQWSTLGIVHNRRVRGRTFLPAPIEADNDATAVPSSAYKTAANGAITTLLSTMTNRMEIWAQPFAGAEGNPARAGTKHIVTGGTTAAYWAILRSRRD
jgi:hypothetical protein